MRLLRWIACILLLVPASAQAAIPDINGPLIDLDKAVGDNPSEVLHWLQTYLPTITPESHPRAWVRAQIMHDYALSMRYEDKDPQKTHKDLGQALEMAQKQGFLAEEIVLLLLYVEDVSDDKGQARREMQIRMAVDKAEQLGDRRLWLRAKADLAYYLNDLNRKTEAIPLFREVQEAIKNDPTLDRMEVAITKVKIGFMLDDADMGGQKTVAIYENVLKEFRELGLRQFQVTMIYNIAMTLVLEEHETVKSQRYFQELLKLCPEVEDWPTYAMALAGLSDQAFEEGKIKQADDYLRQARKILKGKYEQPYVYLLLDYIVPQAMKRELWVEALRDLDEAIPRIQPTDASHKNTALTNKQKVLAKLGRHAEAYAILRDIYQRYKKEQEDKEKAGFDKLKVELGLTVEEEKSKNLEMQNQLQAEQIRNVRRLQIASLILLLFFAAVMGLMVVAIRRGRVIKAAKEKMQQILETIDEGLVTIARDLTIIDEHSPFMQQLFPEKTLAGMNVVDAILRSSPLNEEELSMAQESLRASLGEEALNWDFNSGHLPQELHLKDGRWISLHWQPITEQGRVEKILLAIRDVTMRHQLEEKVARQQRMMQGLQRKVNEILSARTQDVRRLLEHLIGIHPDLRESCEQKKQRAHWLRVIHTAKGEARGLGLKELSARIHQLEDALKADAAETLQTVFAEYADTLNEYKYLIRDVFGLQEQPHTRDTQLLDILAPLTAALRAQLQKAGLSLGGLSVDDRIAEWPLSTLNALRMSLVHALTNAADHGYILPQKAGRKVAAAWFGIHAEELEGRIRVEIRDQGAGVDLEKLRRLAEVRRFEPAPDETIADVVFMDGASTTEQVSETSGRGIGLSAVRAICRSTGGNAWFRPNDQGAGALLVLEFKKTAPISVAS